MLTDCRITVGPDPADWAAHYPVWLPFLLTVRLRGALKKVRFPNRTEAQNYLDFLREP